MADDDKEKEKRPEPPVKVDNPLPSLAMAMKALGEMQVTITKVVEELDVKRQADYVAAIKAWDDKKDGGKAKEDAAKHDAEFLFNQREVARLKRKLENRPCQPTAELHAMAVPAVIQRVLQHGEFDKANLQAFCTICKAWILPCRRVMFANLSDLKVSGKQRLDGLIALLTARQALAAVIKSVTFSFQPSDPSSPKAVALRESLPTPFQLILLLTLCADAKALAFENMATFGATKLILCNVATRIEKCTIDPKGYGWHGKDVEFGTDGQRALFGDWTSLQELQLARVQLKIHSSETYSRGVSDSTYPAKCPLKKLHMEKVRLRGRLYDVLEGARGHLAHLALLNIGSLALKDLCMVLTEHGPTMTQLTIASCEITETESHIDDDDENESGAAWVQGGGMRWSAGQRPSHGAFDRALSACLNLVNLSIEPGSCPIYQPETLLRPLSKLEVLEFSMRNAHAYDPVAWITLMGLIPVLAEDKRKLKKINFGHEWNSDDRRIMQLRKEWSKYADEIKMGRLSRQR